MIRVFETDRYEKFFATMITVLAAMDAKEEDIKECFDQYVSVVFPEMEVGRESFMKRAEAAMERFVGKKFTVDPHAGTREGGSLRDDMEYQ